jgi:hypothetical protein
LNLQVTLQEFYKWAVDFIGPINKPMRRIGARCIIIMIDYCRAEIVAQFLFENVVTRFGCPKVCMSDQGTHILNKTIASLIEEFQI